MLIVYRRSFPFDVCGLWRRFNNEIKKTKKLQTAFIINFFSHLVMWAEPPGGARGPVGAGLHMGLAPGRLLPVEVAGEGGPAVVAPLPLLLLPLLPHVHQGALNQPPLLPLLFQIILFSKLISQTIFIIFADVFFLVCDHAFTSCRDDDGDGWRVGRRFQRRRCCRHRRRWRRRDRYPLRCACCRSDENGNAGCWCATPTAAVLRQVGRANIVLEPGQWRQQGRTVQGRVVDVPGRPLLDSVVGGCAGVVDLHVFVGFRTRVAE